MKKLITTFFFVAVLFCTSTHGLQRKRKEKTECYVSATGKEVCTSKTSDSNGDSSGSSSDEIYADDDDFEEVEEEVDDGCIDTHANCKFWADTGECGKNPNYMLRNCPVSCNSCPKKKQFMNK